MVKGFGDQDLEILKNQDFLLTKNIISEKIIRLLSDTESTLKSLITTIDFKFPIGTKLKSGKISRGDNYRGLPYFVLDFPRMFSVDDVFAYRTMIWWGHEISFTIHLQGKSFQQLRENILTRRADLMDYYLCTNETPWEYNFDSDNYIAIRELPESQYKDQIENMSFIKLSTLSPLDSIEEVNKNAEHHLNHYLKVLS